MSGFVRIFDLIPAAAALLVAALPAWSAPQRVVSMNLCTDQIAMLLASPGQLVSVSDLAQDPRMSPMAEEAQVYPINYGRAEEIYLMRPDLVIAGQFASAPTVAMLRRLGIRVEVRAPAESIAAIRTEISEVGALLGREEAARDLIADFDSRLAALRRDPNMGRAALYYANGFTSGRGTLAGEILNAAGYQNIAGDYGIANTAPLPLELLVMSRPDRLITGARWPGRSRSEAILDHPALAATTDATAEVTDRDWVCGTPYILRAIEALE